MGAGGGAGGGAGTKMEALVEPHTSHRSSHSESSARYAWPWPSAPRGSSALSGRSWRWEPREPAADAKPWPSAVTKAERRARAARPLSSAKDSACAQAALSAVCARRAEDRSRGTVRATTTSATTRRPERDRPVIANAHAPVSCANHGWNHQHGSDEGAPSPGPVVDASCPELGTLACWPGWKNSRAAPKVSASKGTDRPSHSRRSARARSRSLVCACTT
mmetsp:Transcript_27143/g.79887  ORF Transcript_27143/g.79887 Transcript_27143/m.79887 type:complete len:220 (-) Transcript_27143:728-1387(-)